MQKDRLDYSRGSRGGHIDHYDELPPGSGGTLGIVRIVNCDECAVDATLSKFITIENVKSC